MWEGLNLHLIDVHHQCIIDLRLEHKYAALSYVWGSAPRFVLCEQNVHKLRNAGSLAEQAKDIPQTFLDALDVTGRMRINYLWIDACALFRTTKKMFSHI